MLKLVKSLELSQCWLRKLKRTLKKEDSRVKQSNAANFPRQAKLARNRNLYETMMPFCVLGSDAKMESL